jgi:D-glycero-alpha-D-manno-heptose-7-phosphate kinase
MEFYADDKVIINPLRINSKIINELSNNIVLFYTKTSHDSSEIIMQQQQNVKSKNSSSIEAMHNIKAQAQHMKEALLKGELDKIGDVLNEGWEYKKKMASGISTALFEKIYDAAIAAGARGGKISGAGGGGFIFFYCAENKRYNVIEALSHLDCVPYMVEFTKDGLKTWTIR